MTTPQHEPRPFMLTLMNSAISAKFARRLCASRLSWQEKADILGMPLSTVQRHYGVRKTKT